MSALNGRKYTSYVQYQENKEFFEQKVSRTYNEVHGKVIAARSKILIEKYYKDFIKAGESILDIGNGGCAPEGVVGVEVAGQLGSFIGFDASFSMLARSQNHYPKTAGNALEMPFKDSSFDHVLINCLFHHLGFNSEETNGDRIQQLIHEALRVTRNSLIICEPVTWNWIEKIERRVFKLLKSFPLYMQSELSLLETLSDVDISVKQFQKYTLTQLTSPFYCYPLCMAVTWPRFPAFLSIYDHLFFIVKRT